MKESPLAGIVVFCGTGMGATAAVRGWIFGGFWLCRAGPVTCLAEPWKKADGMRALRPAGIESWRRIGIGINAERWGVGGEEGGR